MSCITLLSDFGLQDASVAIAKGILMQHTPALPIIDISHEVTPFHTAQAAYLLADAAKNFPAGTCHLLLFDLFSEKTPQLLLCEKHGQYFLAPDNGVLPLALGTTTTEGWQCAELEPTDSFKDWLAAAGGIISRIQDAKPSSLHLPTRKLRTATKSAPQVVSPDEVVCEVIHIDNYENVVINMTRDLFESMRNGRNFRLQFVLVEEIEEISNNYADVRPGFKLCRFNSNGYMEISINRANAASLFGIRLGRNNEIKILFE
jgi:S-adenosyl-L-methionine hydrolase (adenosine-forming)